MTKESHSATAFNLSKVKSKYFQTELETIFELLKQHTATASMVSEATGIKQKNITRYKRDLEKAGLLWEVYKSHCKVTGNKAYYLTTNPNNIQVSQLNLF